jgi:hypothetical protein
MILRGYRKIIRNIFKNHPDVIKCFSCGENINCSFDVEHPNWDTFEYKCKCGFYLSNGIKSIIKKFIVNGIEYSLCWDFADPNDDGRSISFDDFVMAIEGDDEIYNFYSCLPFNINQKRFEKLLLLI